jgi:uncharacterized protein YidB (DUF937 family)
MDVIKMKKKNLAIGSGLLAAGLAAGSIFAPLGLAGAQDDLPETDSETEAEAPETNHRRGPRGLRGARGEAVAEALGMTTDEVKAALQEGSTLAEIAATQGISEADLVSQLVAQAQAHIDELVASGDLTAEEAAEKSAGLQERVTNAVNADPSERQGHRGRKGHGPALETLGEILGLTTDEIKEGFAAGQSIADMATAQGVDVDSVVDQLVAEAMERVDAAVEAGKIDAERAAEISEGLEEKISDRVNADPSERPGRGERRGPRGPRGGDAEGEATETGLDA